MSIKEKGIFAMMGKTIKEIIVNEGCSSLPNYHLFIIFTDGSCYEFYGSGDINPTSGLLPNGGLEYAKLFHTCRIKRYCKDEHDNCVSEVIK